MQINNKPENITIEVLANPDQTLYDKRVGNHGLIFGVLKDVADQYGVKFSFNNGIMTCSAPKSRMQKFVEKLHFCTIKYREI